MEPHPAPADNEENDDPHLGDEELNVNSELTNKPNSDDNRSQKSSRTGSEQSSGVFSNNTTRQHAINLLQQVPEEMGDGLASPISLLKSKMPEIQHAKGMYGIDVVTEDQCYHMLREMELVDEIEDHLDEDELPQHWVSESEVDATVFPTLMETVAKIKKKWGPVQATRTSTRVGNSNVPIMQKAQELKKVQNLEVNRDKGKNQIPFSLFKNSSFLDVARKVGVEVDGQCDAMSSDLSATGGGLESNVGAALDYKTPSKIRDTHFFSSVDEVTLTSS